MRQLGFDGYALDYIDCPDGLLWFLQKDANMHRTAIALNVNAVDVNRAMDAISNPATGGFGSFIVGKVMNNVSRSAYGKRLATNQTKDVRAAQNLGAHQGMTFQHEHIYILTLVSQLTKIRSGSLTGRSQMHGGISSN